MNDWIVDNSITAITITAGSIMTNYSAIKQIELSADEVLDLADANFLLDLTKPPSPIDIIEFVRELGIIVKD